METNRIIQRRLPPGSAARKGMAAVEVRRHVSAAVMKPGAASRLLKNAPIIASTKPGSPM